MQLNTKPNQKCAHVIPSVYAGGKADAKRHYKNIHMTKGEKNFSCKLPGCDKKFGNAKYMKAHMCNGHGISAKMLPSTSKPTATKKSGKTKPSKKVIAEEPQNVKAESTED